MTPGVRPLIAGNWKMHGSLREAGALAEAVRAGAATAAPAAELLVCPPVPHIPLVAEALAGQGVAVGAQDCHAAAKGAHTGDVAAPMLRDAGAAYVILGHSERRANHGEADAAVRAKAEAALAAGLIPHRLCRRERGAAACRRGRGHRYPPARWQPAGWLRRRRRGGGL